MKLKYLINNKKIKNSNVNILGLSLDSREIKKNYIFFSKNILNNQEKYILEAINNGAKLIIYEGEILLNIEKYSKSCEFYITNDIDELMSNIVKKFYKIEDKYSKIIGITGTNGKSSIAIYIAQLIKIKKEKCGVIGTLGNGVYPLLKDKRLTTPNILDINKCISNFTKKNVKNIVIEASSHGIKQNRIKGLKFDTVIFTNLTRDHLDYHKSMNDYYNTKLKLFTEYPNKRKIVCIDCYYGKKIKKLFKSKNNIRTVSLVDNKADFYASNIVYSEKGISFIINSKYGKRKIITNLYGEFSVTNILLSIASLAKNKSEYKFYADNIINLKAAEGRMNMYFKKNYPPVFIDFSHTPDSIEKVLISIRKHFPDNKIITIFGCGGNRDKDKRKIMGKIASKLSDEIVITNDNPRNEDPKKISNDIISGIRKDKKFKVILNRNLAIKKFINKDNSNKITLILGKGHEEFQIVKNKRINYSDKNEVLKNLKL